MSKEIKKEEIEDAFDKSINKLNELRGKVKAFMLLAITDEPSEEREGVVLGINSVAGKMKDLVTIFENISPDIKSAAGRKGLVDILGEFLEGLVSEKGDGEK